MKTKDLYDFLHRQFVTDRTYYNPSLTYGKWLKSTRGQLLKKEFEEKFDKEKS